MKWEPTKWIYVELKMKNSKAQFGEIWVVVHLNKITHS